MAVKGVPSAAGQPVNHRPLSAASVWFDTPETQEQHEPVNTGVTMIIKTFRVDLTSASAV